MVGTKKTKRRVGEDVLRSEKDEGREQASTPEKPPSPAKTESSEDTRESAASNVDAKEEDYAKEQDFLPTFIRKRKYSNKPEEADKQLWEDIRKEDKKTGGSFLDQKFLKYIFIDAVTRQAYVQMPSKSHQEVVLALHHLVNSRSTPGDHVLAETIGGMDLKDEGGRKNPDVSIFDQDRTDVHKKYGFLKKKKTGFEPMNPNAIIEVSWTNKIEDEFEKFALEMKECQIDDLGAINVGYLIKFIPEEYFPNKKHPDRPLVGIDVYRMEPGDEEPTMFSSWRHGKNYPDDLIITKEQLGQEDHGGGVSISFETIVDELTSLGVLWEEPGEN